MADTAKKTTTLGVLLGEFKASHAAWQAAGDSSGSAPLRAMRVAETNLAVALIGTAYVPRPPGEVRAHDEPPGLTGVIDAEGNVFVSMHEGGGVPGVRTFKPASLEHVVDVTPASP